MIAYINCILDSIPVFSGAVLFFVIPFIVHYIFIIFNRILDRFYLKNVAALLFIIYHVSFLVGYVWYFVLYYIRVGNSFLIYFFALMLISFFVVCAIFDIRSIKKIQKLKNE